MRKNRFRAICTLTLLMGSLFFLSTGCSGKLFPDNEPRSQYFRYDRLRGQAQPQVILDDAGREQVNLRNRLERKQY